MHKLLLSSGLAALAVVAVASGANGAGPDFQKVSGAGISQSQGLVQVNADNRDDPSGPSGQFFIGDVQAEGEVTCLTVFPGGAARIGGVDRTGGTAYLIFIVDDGEPGNQGDAHTWRQASVFEVTEPGCGLIHLLPVPIESGNYSVSTPAT